MAQWIVGIDEVGRGPLAGPVTVCALALKPGTKCKNLRDSKRLSAKQREAWLRWIKEKKMPHALASVSPKVVDRIHIGRAANLAATRAFLKLAKRCGIPAGKTKVFLDGGLYLNALKIRGYKPQTVIKGDEKIPAISLASIVAKVARDGNMKRLSRKYPDYRFDVHKGYGTPSHIAALAKYGPCDMHRLTFVQKFCKITTNDK